MTIITRGRIIPNAQGARVIRSDATTATGGLPTPLVSVRDRRRVAREELEAHLMAESRIRDAEARAEEIVAGARAEAASVVLRVSREARDAEQAKLAALYLALRAEDERRAERDVDRSIALAVVLAERLLGRALEQQPDVIVALARQALAEAQGARRVMIEAHPLDEPVLKSHLLDVGMSEATVEVRANTELARGSLCVHTNLGTLDAQLTPQLERLANALRDAFKPA